jgi:hypothetical protein
MAASAAVALVDGASSRARRSAARCWSATAVVGGVGLLALVLTVIAVGRELAAIQSLASDMRTVVLPQVMAQQRRAIWIESLRSAAQVVVYAPGRATRQDALSKAEQLAANVTDLASANGGRLTGAWALIRRAAERTDEAERIDGEIRARLLEADSLIGDMSASLGSIVADSAGTLARLIKEVLSAGNQDGLTRQTLEEVLSINTTSQDLLASLDQGRILLAAARSMNDTEEIERAATHFNAIGQQLTLRVDTLRGNTDYEYLPAMIRRFVGLAVIFQLRRDWLDARSEAMAASHQATLQLGLLRETLNADAADSAERGVASITTSLERIGRSAAGALIAVLIVGAMVAWRYRSTMAATAAHADAGAVQAQRADELARAQLQATLASLEVFVTERANLEHLCQSLPLKLRQTAGGVLEHLARVEQRSPASAAAEPLPPARYCRPCPPCRPEAPVDGRSSPLPEGWSAPGVVELVQDIAAVSTAAALHALHGSVRAIHGMEIAEAVPGAPSGHDRADHSAANGDLALSLRSLELAAEVAGSTTEQVTLALAEMNALVRGIGDAGEAPDAERVLAEINRRIDLLRDALGATLDALRAQLSGAA